MMMAQQLSESIKNRRLELGQSKRWVIKIGSAMVTNEGLGLDRQYIAQWVAQMAALHAAGCDIVLVSSGAVAEGMQRLGWRKRPAALHALQAAAAVGQMGLVQAYESAFEQHNIRTAQVLLTHDDAADRKRYLNIRSTLRTLLDHRVIPVINENDTVAFEEIRFGDNDSLGALVANLVEAPLYVILTDQQGLYDKDPRKHVDAVLLPEVVAGDTYLETIAGGEGGSLGRGGMLTKVHAAAKAAKSGSTTWIAWGREPNVLSRIATGGDFGTVFVPNHSQVVARKQWLSAQLQISGRVYLDEGAVRALTEAGKSLLPVGVLQVEGHFSRGELIVCIAPSGREIARGLTHYSANEIQKILKTPSDQIEAKLGFLITDELIHRDNLVLM